MGGLELFQGGVARLPNGVVVALAPRRRRIVARAIDFFVVAVVAYWVAYLAVWVMWARPPWALIDPDWYHLPESYRTGDDGIVHYTGKIGGPYGRLVTLQVSWYITAFFYDVVFVWLGGSTLGKWCRGLRVVSSSEGRSLGVMSSLARSLHWPILLTVFVIAESRSDAWAREMYISFSIAFFGLLYAAFTALLLLSMFDRGLHDMAARSLVTLKRRPQPASSSDGVPNSQETDDLALRPRYPRPAAAPAVLPSE
ncbi:RDD family protein [Candidatus Poriferisodalis sp.]|uniref:RDD family protein n=1 Tax=Candidatus Poriferisodalis sp. TaxID=3101277 RepID=UPI003B017ECE